MKLTHLTEQGHAHMADISNERESKHTAIAEGFVTMQTPTLATVLSQRAKKGDVLATARVAGIMAAKKTSDLLPLAHPSMLSYVAIDLIPVWGDDEDVSRTQPGHARGKAPCGIHVVAQTSQVGRAGVEMEALTAVSVACLTIYDMCKTIDRNIEINEIRLVHNESEL